MSIFSASIVPLPQYFVASRSSILASSITRMTGLGAMPEKTIRSRPANFSSGPKWPPTVESPCPFDNGLTAPKQHLLPDGAKFPDITPGVTTSRFSGPSGSAPRGTSS